VYVAGEAPSTLVGAATGPVQAPQSSDWSALRLQVAGTPAGECGVYFAHGNFESPLLNGLVELVFSNNSRRSPYDVLIPLEPNLCQSEA
jgi:hypothetical protein